MDSSNTVRPRGRLLVGALCLAFTACADGASRAPDDVPTPATLPVRVNEIQPFDGSVADAARGYLRDRRAALGLSRHADFLVRTIGRSSGSYHVRLEQLHRGVAVWGAQAIVHASEHSIKRVNGNLVPGLGDFDAVVRVADTDALDLAKQHHASQMSGPLDPSYQGESVELVLYVHDKQPHLAWHTHFIVEPRNGYDAGRWHHFIDVESGLLLASFDWLTTLPTQGSGPGGNPNINRTWMAELDVLLAGPDYIMDTTTDIDVDDPTVHSMRTEDYGNSTNNGQTVVGPLGSVGDSTENDAHGFTEIVLDMMYYWYGFDSIEDLDPFSPGGNDEGYTLVSRVHYSTQTDNAYWDGTQMTYFDGGTSFYDLTGDIDVVGHEISHGFTERHSGLLYNHDQPGALNESFSDVAGTLAEFYHEGDGAGGADFDIGADVAIPGALPWPGDALRFMCNPTQDTYSVDHYNDFAVGLDNHYGSGIPNKAFCLAASRLSDPNNHDPATPVTVTGVQQAGYVWYYANAFEWGPSETFSQACDGIVAQAMAAGYNAGQIQALVDSWLDVGVACHGQTPPIDCDAVWTAESGVITSPNFPANYPDHHDFIDCILPGSGAPATFTFTHFHVEDGWDFLDIIDGATNTLLAEDLTGMSLPADTTSSFLVVRFTTDGSIARPGWRATWDTGVSSNAPPAASFTHLVDELTVAFTDGSEDSDGTLVSWHWDFGDGDTSSEQHPNHTFLASGTYDVELTVTDDDGDSDSHSETLSVEGANAPPNASFTVSAVDLEVAFTDTSSDGDGTLVAWFWEFGDGGSSTDRHPIHTYAASGTYIVQLTVHDDVEAMDTAMQMVALPWTNNAPTADFSYAADQLDVAFSDISADRDGTIVAWLWDFDDGNTSTAQHPVHTFSSDGTYTVQLTVQDDLGSSDTAARTVSLLDDNALPMASFGYTATELEVSFTDTSDDSDGVIAAWSWDFGDGHTSVTRHPAHTYGDAGSHDVVLTVTDDRGGVHSVTRTVLVSEDSGGCHSGGRRPLPWGPLLALGAVLALRRRASRAH